jgi:putative ABC transport system ATP-binding protein
MYAIQAFELYRFYHSGDDETAALRGVDLALGAGDFVALVGPSGSGKSTLLTCLAGLDEPDGGHVEVLGKRLSRRPEDVRANVRARHIGLLMQFGNLFDHLTVKANVALQIKLAGKGDLHRIEALLDSLGLREQADARPSELSGGEEARAGLAVALATDPEILLCDEPTAEVDLETELRILDRLNERRRAGGTILVATHSAEIARKADCIIRIADGRIAHA